MDRQDNKVLKVFSNIVKHTQSDETLSKIIFISVAIIFLFSAMLLSSLFMNGAQLNNAQKKLSDIKEITQAMRDCNSDGTTDCTQIDAALIVTNQNLESINNALKLEEIGALIGIFVTISTIVLPIILTLNMRHERTSITSELNNTENRIRELSKENKEYINKIAKETKENSEKELGSELEKTDERFSYHRKMIDSKLETIMEKIDLRLKENSNLINESNRINSELINNTLLKVDEAKKEIINQATSIINNRSLTRNQIMLHVYQAKASYFIDQTESIDDNINFSIQDNLEVQARAHEIELSIIKLMSQNKREVEIAVHSLRELLDSSDYKKPFMRHIRLAVETIASSPDYTIYQWQQTELQNLREWLFNPDESL